MWFGSRGASCAILRRRTRWLRTWDSARRTAPRRLRCVQSIEPGRCRAIPSVETDAHGRVTDPYRAVAQAAGEHLVARKETSSETTTVHCSFVRVLDLILADLLCPHLPRSPRRAPPAPAPYPLSRSTPKSADRHLHSPETCIPVFFHATQPPNPQIFHRGESADSPAAGSLD